MKKLIIISFILIIVNLLLDSYLALSYTTLSKGKKISINSHNQLENLEIQYLNKKNNPKYSKSILKSLVSENLSNTRVNNRLIITKRNLETSNNFNE